MIARIGGGTLGLMACGSGDAAGVEPGAVLAVVIFDVGRVPIAQELEDGSRIEFIAVLGAKGGFLDLRQQALVGVAMLGRSGKGMLLEQLLFAGEVHARELDEAVQAPAYMFASLAVDHGESNVVQRVHQDGVLLVHCLDAYRAGMVPRQLGHDASDDLEAEFQSGFLTG